MIVENTEALPTVPLLPDEPPDIQADHQVPTVIEYACGVTVNDALY